MRESGKEKDAGCGYQKREAVVREPLKRPQVAETPSQKSLRESGQD